MFWKKKSLYKFCENNPSELKILQSLRISCILLCTWIVGWLGGNIFMTTWCSYRFFFFCLCRFMFYLRAKQECLHHSRISILTHSLIPHLLILVVTMLVFSCSDYNNWTVFSNLIFIVFVLFLYRDIVTIHHILQDI